jgi:hypothetical protein
MQARRLDDNSDPAPTWLLFSQPTICWLQCEFERPDVAQASDMPTAGLWNIAGTSPQQHPSSLAAALALSGYNIPPQRRRHYHPAQKLPQLWPDAVE